MIYSPIIFSRYEVSDVSFYEVRHVKKRKKKANPGKNPSRTQVKDHPGTPTTVSLKIVL